MGRNAVVEVPMPSKLSVVAFILAVLAAACSGVRPKLAGGRLPDVIDHADLELEHRLMSDLNMMAVTGGKERSAFEWKALLNNAGFDCQRIISVPGQLVSIIEAARSV